MLIGSWRVFPIVPIRPMLQNISNTLYCFPYTKMYFSNSNTNVTKFISEYKIVISGHSIIIIITNYFSVKRGCFTAQILQFMKKKMYLILTLWRPEQKRFVYSDVLWSLILVSNNNGELIFKKENFPSNNFDQTLTINCSPVLHFVQTYCI